MCVKVLFVDDEQGVLDGLRRALRKEPYEVLTALSSEEALQILAEEDIDVVVSDENMPGMGGSEFLKTVRPIDNIHLVIYDDKPQVTVGETPLHARVFNSSDISKLKNFLNDSHGRGLTSKTYLYEAMLAGVDIIRKMPARDNKFMVVFSDGEDLNSTIEPDAITNNARGIENFEIFCIDYMPGSKFDRFLTALAKTHNGFTGEYGGQPSLFLFLGTEKQQCLCPECDRSELLPDSRIYLPKFFQDHSLLKKPESRSVILLGYEKTDEV